MATRRASAARSSRSPGRSGRCCRTDRRRAASPPSPTASGSGMRPNLAMNAQSTRMREVRGMHGERAQEPGGGGRRSHHNYHGTRDRLLDGHNLTLPQRRGMRDDNAQRLRAHVEGHFHFEAARVLGRLLAIPDDAVEELRGAHGVLRHVGLHHGGGLLVDLDLGSPSSRPRDSPGLP
jgi:hypothetical protein